MLWSRASLSPMSTSPSKTRRFLLFNEMKLNLKKIYTWAFPLLFI